MTTSIYSELLLWSDEQAAAAIGITVKRLQQLARDGVIPAFKIGRVWRFNPDAIREWVKNKGTSAPAEEINNG